MNSYLLKTIRLILYINLISSLFAQTTGKISGKILDSKTEQPILGANIIILDTYLGASTDQDGSYFILNVPPGKYNILISYPLH